MFLIVIQCVMRLIEFLRELIIDINNVEKREEGEQAGDEEAEAGV